MIDLVPSAGRIPRRVHGRAAGRGGPTRWKAWLPPLVSAGLVGWLVWRVSPSALREAAVRQNLAILVPATFGLVAALYLWDAVCLRWLFARPGRRVRYAAALLARGVSYLVGVVNYELGQAALAWLMARAVGMGLLPAVGRCVLLAVHDGTVLLTLGLIGSLGDSDPRAVALRPWCAAGLAVLAAGLTLASLRRRWRAPRGAPRRGTGMGGWDWARSVRLYGLRLAYFGFIVTYAAVGLALCRVPLNRGVVLGVIPLVLLADGLPVSVSGLGTRETALLYLLRPEDPAGVLAWSLLWSTGLVVGRAGIGLAGVWLGRRTSECKEDDS